MLKITRIEYLENDTEEKDNDKILDPRDPKQLNQFINNIINEQQYYNGDNINYRD